MDIGHYIKWSDTEYDVLVDPAVRNSGYNVVSKDIDPANKYSLADVAAYAAEHPEMELPQWPEIVPSTEELATQARCKRNELIQSIRWRVERHNDELALGLPTTESIEPILQYIQALRDIPDQEGFPTNVIWPEEPKV